jgi:hypothetical protein
VIWQLIFPQLSRVMLGIVGCSIQPDSLTLGLTSIGAPHHGQLTAWPGSLACLQYRQRWLVMRWCSPRYSAWWWTCADWMSTLSWPELAARYQLGNPRPQAAPSTVALQTL